jgi:hypothetical protein
MHPLAGKTGAHVLVQRSKACGCLVQELLWLSGLLQLQVSKALLRTGKLIAAFAFARLHALLLLTRMCYIVCTFAAVLQLS